VRVYDTFSISFRFFWVENLIANLLHQSRHVEIDAAGSQQVRWFVRVLDKWNAEKNRFEPAKESVEAGFSLRILLFLECTDVHPEILHVLTDIIDFHQYGSRVLSAPYLCLSLIYCLTHVVCFHFFLAAIAAPKLQTTSAMQATTMCFKIYLLCFCSFCSNK